MKLLIIPPQIHNLPILVQWENIWWRTITYTTIISLYAWKTLSRFGESFWLWRSGEIRRSEKQWIFQYIANICIYTVLGNSKRDHRVFLAIHPRRKWKTLLSLPEETPGMGVASQELYLFVWYLDIGLHIIEILHEKSKSLRLIASLQSIDSMKILLRERACETVACIGREEN